MSIEALNARLADGIDLALAIKQAHWNLKGPQFIGIHLMLDGFRAEISGLNDKVAERAVQLGGTALGTAQVVAGSTKLPAYPTGIYAIADHIAALIDSYAAYANAVRENIDETERRATPTRRTYSPRCPVPSTSNSGSLRPTFKSRRARCATATLANEEHLPLRFRPNGGAIRSEEAPSSCRPSLLGRR